MPDYNSYQKSISEELKAIKNRVRNFIDEKHWGEDGRYHEIILRDIISEKLPAFASCGTGFIIGTNQRLSTQIDIIVYRNDIPLSFKRGDFIIAPQESVLGIIEVKAKLYNSNINESVEKAHANGSLFDHDIFNGIFSYEEYDKERRPCIDHGQIANLLRSNCGKVNYISFGKDYFLKYWDEGHPIAQNHNKYSLYHIEDLSFGYFISNLIEDSYIAVMDKAIPETLKAVLYPIEETKEAHRIEELIL